MCVSDAAIESSVNTTARIQPDSGTRVLTGTQPISAMAMFPSVAHSAGENPMWLPLFHGRANAGYCPRPPKDRSPQIAGEVPQLVPGHGLERNHAFRALGFRRVAFRLGMTTWRCNEIPPRIALPAAELEPKIMGQLRGRKTCTKIRGVAFVFVGSCGREPNWFARPLPARVSRACRREFVSALARVRKQFDLLPV
jgi:hypothetical protein